MAKLFVGNLPWDTSEEEIKKMLAEYGVKNISMPKDRETGKFRGFSFAEVDDDKAQQAVTDLNQGEFGGRTIKVDIAVERPREFKKAPQRA